MNYEFICNFVFDIINNYSTSNSTEMKKIVEDNQKSIIEITESNFKNFIKEIRGQQVILDSDLAEIYGYTTKAFNQQVKNNIEKFDDDFRFQLTKNEYDEILRSSFLTLE